MSGKPEGRDTDSGRGTTHKAPSPAGTPATSPAREPADPYLRAEGEDDDGYDPFSDRPARREPLFEHDPWR